MSPAPIVVVGDVLLDQDIDGDATRLAPDAPVPVVDVARERSRPGGAGLAAALAARGGRTVVLVTALGTDSASDTVRALVPPGVRLVEIPLHGTLPVKARIFAGGRPLVRVDRGEGTPGHPGPHATAMLREASAVLVADYGGGTADTVRGQLAAAARRVPLVWDPHPSGGAPVPGARLATPNDREVRHFLQRSRRLTRRHEADCEEDTDDSLHAHSRRGALLAERWRAGAVAVTLGDRGAVLTRAGCDGPLYVPVTPSPDGDPCGAGDCFAATAATALADGHLPADAVQRATQAAAAFVAAGGARALTGTPAGANTGGPDAVRSTTAGPPAAAVLVTAVGARANAIGPHPSGPRTAPADGGEPARGWARPVARGVRDALALAASVRAAGGIVVAAGGCFDLLHAGHVDLLENARRTGDCLIVCINSDPSVRRLKGAGRPVNQAGDRIRVLAGLGCVDGVVTFDEDTPEALLRRLRPDVWVKGGDYSTRDLPEAATLREWGGQALVLPCLDGRSTTELARRAAGAR